MSEQKKKVPQWQGYRVFSTNAGSLFVDNKDNNIPKGCYCNYEEVQMMIALARNNELEVFNKLIADQNPQFEKEMVEVGKLLADEDNGITTVEHARNYLTQLADEQESNVGC
jgi:hypothetical protein